MDKGNAMLLYPFYYNSFINKRRLKLTCCSPYNLLVYFSILWDGPL